MSDCLYLRIDSSSVVVGTLRSPDPQPDSIVSSQGLVLVDAPTYAAASAEIGACQWVNGALQSYTPAVTLAQAQAAQSALLTAACQAAIVGGYSSSALGSAYTYPSRDIDQINMAGSVLASLLPGLASGWTTPFWCADVSDVWAMRPHTVSQIQQAGSDGKAAVLAAQQRLVDLLSQVAAATSVSAVQSVTW